MTIDIMFVVVLASVLFNIQPLTPIMIVGLALLDDIPIMTIAYDNVSVSQKPVKWDMHHIYLFSSIMGLLAIIQSFGLILICKFWMMNAALMSFVHLNFTHMQTLLFLQLAAGGHLLVFNVRKRGWLIQPPYPSKPLLLAVIGTQIFAVLMCAYGLLVPAVPWVMIGMVWAYVLIWMFVMDVVKNIYYHVMDRRAMQRSVIDQPILQQSPV